MYPWRCVWFLSAMVATAFPSPPFPPPQPLVSSCSCTTLNVNQTSTAGGDTEGDLLIDLTMGSLDRPLYFACESFNDIIVLEVSDQCITEMKGWMEKHRGAFYRDRAVKLHVQFKGKSYPVEDEEEEKEVRSASQDVVKCAKDQIVLPPADIVMSAGVLDNVAMDEAAYQNYLKKFRRLLIPGGRVTFTGNSESTCFK